MSNEMKVFTRAEQTAEGQGKLAKVIVYPNGAEVSIPINANGSVKWFDDTQLIRK